MTKDLYFEMCDQLGNIPIDEEIPIEYEDLYEEIQEAVIVYNMLQDNWDSMNGLYLGKNFVGIKDIFDIMGVDDPRTCFSLLSILDSERSKIFNKKVKEETKKPAKK